MHPLDDFLNQYHNNGSKTVNRSALYAFLDSVYGKQRAGKRATKIEIERYRDLTDQYIKEDRDHVKDLLAFTGFLHGMPPLTAKSYMACTREFLGYHDIELSSKDVKRIRGKMPKGHARTVERDLDRSILTSLLTHMDAKGRALLLVLISSGMRIGELLQIWIEDLDTTSPPAKITIRGELTKTGDQRITFISAEALAAVREWLKVRDQYITSAENRNSGLIKSGISRSRKKADPRLFPFSPQTALQIWNSALEKAGLDSIDRGTGRRQIHIHSCRKFFRSQLALGCPVDIVEALMGHAGYLTKAYRIYGDKQIAEYYQKGEHLLTITIPEDLELLRKDQAEQREILTAMASENRQLRSDLTALERELNSLKGFMEVVSQNPDVLVKAKKKSV